MPIMNKAKTLFSFLKMYSKFYVTIITIS
uniref:Uncharacterized protein n=1 Tax=Anopheles quadriannulatus TaxID=34691 RepID=A0A182XT79_ANOQN